MRRFDVPEAGPIVFGFHTMISWKRKVDTTKKRFQLRKRSEKMLLVFQLMKFFVCSVLTSHGILGPHFMNSQFMNDLESGVVQYLGKYSRRNPAHLQNTLRKQRVSN